MKMKLLLVALVVMVGCWVLSADNMMARADSRRVVAKPAQVGASQAGSDFLTDSINMVLE